MTTEELCRHRHADKTRIRSIPFLYSESDQEPLIDQILVEIYGAGPVEGVSCDRGRVINSPIVSNALAYGDHVGIPQYGLSEHYTIVKRSPFSAAGIRILRPSGLDLDLYEDMFETLRKVPTEHVFPHQRAQRLNATTAPDEYIAVAFDASVTERLQLAIAPFERRGDIEFRIHVDKRHNAAARVGEG